MNRLITLSACLTLLTLTLGPLPASAKKNILKSYFVIETADKSKFDFALDFAENMYKLDATDKEKSQVDIVCVGKAFPYLIDKKSPVSKRYKALRKRGTNVKLIGCGKAVKTMNNYLKEGNIKLLPAVELFENCANYRKKLNDGTWYEIKIPKI